MTNKQHNPPSWDPKTRRRRYKDDPEYRKRAIRSTRSSYRGKFGRLDSSTCLDNLSKLGSMGTRRTIRMDEGFYGRKTVRVTFTTEELAAALNRRVEVIYRWIRKGMFPVPVHWLEEVHNQHDGVYLLPEARAIVRVMGEHQKETSYYRIDHADTKERLFDATDDARHRL